MRIDRSSVPAIYALTAPVAGLDALAVAASLLASGVRWLQFREKTRDDLATLELVRGALEHAGAATIFVNDRVDLALAGLAGGVHLGDRDLPAADARRIAGDQLLIGVSTHSVEQALRAADDDAVDYIAIGPVFLSPTKNVRSPVGIETITKIRDATAKPIVAIGGIDVSNIRRVLDAGADSAAVISALYEGEDIAANVARLIEAAGRA